MDIDKRKVLSLFSLFLSVIAYGLMLYFLTAAANEEAERLDNSIDSIKQDKVNE